MSHADHWKIISEKLKRGIEHCEKTNAETVACTECCFRVSATLCQELVSQTLDRGFGCPVEKRHFVKTVFPEVASRVEFYRLVHYYELFKPPRSSETFAEFYLRELKRVERFLVQHHEFVNYYVSGRTDLDEEYFTEVALCDQVPLAATECITSKETYNIIATRLLALMDFHSYLKNQLTEN